MIKSKTSNKLKDKMSTQFKLYCKHSTMHGMFYLYKCSTWPSWLTWVLVLCCSASLNVFLSHMIWQQYVTDPTVTVVESTHYPTDFLPFPGVVVCDSDLVYGPNTRQLVDILTRRGYNVEKIMNFLESILNFEDPYYISDPASNKVHALLEDIGYPFLAILDMVSKPCEVLLVNCIWRSQKHNCLNMFRRVLTYKGYCCQFDIEYFRKHADNATNLTAYPDRTRGMEIVVNGVKSYSNGTRVDGDTNLFIFDTADQLTLVDSSVAVKSRAYFDVSIDVSAMDASEGVKALPRDVRKCILPKDSSEAGASFYSGCVSNTLMTEIVNNCRCLPFFHSFSSAEMLNYPSCSWDQYRCVTQTRMNFAGSPAELVAFKNCFQKCDYVEYETQVEYVALAWTSASTRNDNEKSVALSHSVLSIHFADRTCMKYRREVLFTWDQMLANIGGIYGLCMGGSIISIIELVWFLLELLYTITHDKISPKISPTNSKKKEKNEFAITKSKNLRKQTPIKYAKKYKEDLGNNFPFRH